MVHQHADELLCVERVPFGRGEQSLTRSLWQKLVSEQGVEECPGLRHRQRPKSDDPRREGLGAPVGLPLQKLRAGRAYNEERYVRGPSQKMFDEVDRGLVRPVQVLEYEHARSVLCHALDEPPPRRERLGASIPDQCGSSFETDKGQEVVLHPPGLVVLDEEIGDRL